MVVGLEWAHCCSINSTHLNPALPESNNHRRRLHRPHSQKPMGTTPLFSITGHWSEGSQVRKCGQVKFNRDMGARLSHMLPGIPVHTSYRSELSSVHPLDRGYHKIYAAWVLLMVSVNLSFLRNSRCFIKTAFSLRRTLPLSLNSTPTKKRRSRHKNNSFP